MLRILPRKKNFRSNGFGRIIPIERKVLATPNTTLREKTSCRRILISPKPIIKEGHRIITRPPSPTCDFAPSMPPPPEPQGGENDPMWKRFDYIGVVCYTGYRNRYEALVKELERVGIRNFHVHWDFPSPYKETLTQHVRMNPQARRSFNIGFNNYNALATAYHLGYNSSLIMEDDVRFLKEVPLLKTIINALPKNYDLAMLDNFDLHNGEFNNFKRTINRWWSRFEFLYSSGCYAMSRKGMYQFIKNYELPFWGKGKLKPNDHYFNIKKMGNDLNLYASIINPAIQFEFTRCNSGSLMEEYYKRLELRGMSKSMYSGM